MYQTALRKGLGQSLAGLTSKSKLRQHRGGNGNNGDGRKGGGSRGGAASETNAGLWMGDEDEDEDYRKDEDDDEDEDNNGIIIVTQTQHSKQLVML